MHDGAKPCRQIRGGNGSLHFIPLASLQLVVSNMVETKKHCIGHHIETGTILRVLSLKSAASWEI
jgi:hypothetical protein